MAESRTQKIIRRLLNFIACPFVILGYVLGFILGAIVTGMEETFY